MLRRLFGWVESPEPVAWPMAPAAQPAAEASGEEEGEEAQLVAQPVAAVRTAVKRSRGDVDGDGEARTQHTQAHTSNRRRQLGSDGQQWFVQPYSRKHREGCACKTCLAHATLID